MSMTLSVRFEHRSFAKVTGQRRHDLRIGPQPKYVDKELSHLNRVLVEPAQPTALRKMCESYRERRGDAKRAMKSDAAVGSHFILTFGIEAQKVIRELNDLDPAFLDQGARLVADRLSERLSVDLTGLVFHMDEEAPHFHGQMPAVTRDGVPLSKVITKDVARELQDIAGAVFEPVTGIKRGERKEEKIKRLKGEGATQKEIDRATVHRNVHQLHEDLPIEIDALEQRLLHANAVFMEKEALLKKAQDKLDAIQNDINAKNGALEKLTQRVETYERRASEVQSEIEKLNLELNRKRDLVERVVELEANEVQQALDAASDWELKR